MRAGLPLRAILLPGLLIAMAAGAYQGMEARKGAAAIIVDYPEDGSIFPPEITPPTFLWRDGAKGVASWRIDVSFGAGPAAIRAASKGARLRIGGIDPDCVAVTNEPPKLTPQLAAAHTWTPDAVTWQAIKRRSAESAATVTITGFRDAAPDQAVSRGKVVIRTSKDPVGAPIFYRDVPLMPAEVERGVIKPLGAQALPFVAWRLRNVGEPRGRVVMDNLPVCANCHSFSLDGKTMGMDLDGLESDRGMYMFAAVKPQLTIRKQEVVQWSSPQGRLRGNVRIGFMSQVSPDGRYVATTINPAALEAPSLEPPSNYYVANFRDYRFLQVFYPGRGLVNWYSRETGVLRPLPGAADPRYVQMGAVWSPDGQYLVFARAQATDPNPPGVPLAKFANDPNELPIQYDLYRIPFHNGEGGEPRPIAGASANGMSNSFPKVSPDGRWIVFVQSRNGQLMRPDSQLYIVPAAGGPARRMRCNTPLMNSWHSFSPNGRWLVFSSKARSPYTQLYLTHIDADGADSPAILIDNTTAANRAANIPEFVNIPPGGLLQIGGPVLDYFRLVNSATYVQKKVSYEASVPKWKQIVELYPDDEFAHRSLAGVLLLTGHAREATDQLQKASELKLRAAIETDPTSARASNDLGALLLQSGRAEEAVTLFEKATALKPDFAAARANLGGALAKVGRFDEALAQLRQALELDAGYAPGHYQLGLVLSRRGDAQGAIREWRSALDLDPTYVEAHDSLGDGLYAEGQSAEALSQWRDAIRLRSNDAAALQRAAWILATSPDDATRKGGEALGFAVRAVQISAVKGARLLDTLAAAYAEKGQFAEAAGAARRALAQAEQESDAALAGAIRARIALYEAGRPFRETVMR